MEPVSVSIWDLGVLNPMSYRLDLDGAYLDREYKLDLYSGGETLSVKFKLIETEIGAPKQYVYELDANVDLDGEVLWASGMIS